MVSVISLLSFLSYFFLFFPIQSNGLPTEGGYVGLAGKNLDITVD